MLGKKFSSGKKFSPGKGILKRSVEVSIDDIDIIITPSEPDKEAEISKHNRGELMRKEGVGSRMVKFEMPSLDSETSDEIQHFDTDNSEIKTELGLRSHPATESSPNISQGEDGIDKELIIHASMFTDSITQLILDMLENFKKEDQMWNLEVKELGESKRENLENLKKTIICALCQNKCYFEIARSKNQVLTKAENITKQKSTYADIKSPNDYKYKDKIEAELPNKNDLKRMEDTDQFNDNWKSR